MHIRFQTQDPEQILQDIQKALLSDAFTKIVSIERKNSSMTVKIKKMGPSTLVFDEQQDSGTIDWVLQTEKIAMAHKPFKEQMLKSISKIIKKLGGEFVQAT